MAQLVVRNLANDIKQRLKERAAEHKLSMDAEIRLILTTVLKVGKGSSPGLGSRIAKRVNGSGLNEPLPELSGQSINPMDL